jgi:hypothetical protein
VNRARPLQKVSEDREEDEPPRRAQDQLPHEVRLDGLPKTESAAAGRLLLSPQDFSRTQAAEKAAACTF